MAVVDDNELLSPQEFEAVLRHKGAPRVGVSWPKFILAITMAILGVAAVIAGVAVIYWPAALVLAGACLLGGAYLIDVSARPQEEQRG